MLIAPDVQLPLSTQRCPLCGGATFETLVRQDRHLLGLETVGCTRCGLLQTNPRPDSAGLADFYTHHYRRLYQGVEDPDGDYVARFRKDERLRYTASFILGMLPLRDDSTLLDYGCGEGSLFVALRAAGYQGRLAGVEPNASFARFAAEAGRATVSPTLNDFGELDGVVINHVLEHLPDPIGVLQELRRRMKPQGRLFVDVPDADRYGGIGDLHLAHIVHFTRRTLIATLESAGYEVLSCEAHDPPHHPKSLRLVAQPATAPAAPPAAPTSGGTEAATWRLMRTIDARRWRWKLSQRMNRFGWWRAAYRAWRQRVTPRAN